MTATLVVSDLHLGAASGVDVLRDEGVRETLLVALDGADELVILGDAVELRDGPTPEALGLARPFFRALGEALGDRRVTIVPGNHDHRLVGEWLEARRSGGRPPALGPEQRIDPAQASGAAARLGEWLGPARLEIAYPGTWLSDGVYAHHGHYLDRHITVPAFEPLVIRAVERFLARRGAPLEGADGYEAVTAPVYALIHELAQSTPPGRRRRGGDFSQRAYRVLSRDGAGPRSIRQRLAASLAFPAAVAAVNRVGLGPVRADISGPELRRASLIAMGEVVRRLEVEGARHVLFGHTHRTGPRPGRDRPEAWRAPSGVRLHNCGNWLYEPFTIGELGRDSPYWPGGAILVEDGEPRPLALLADRGVDELRAIRRAAT